MERGIPKKTPPSMLLAATIEKSIVRGEWKVGDVLSSIHELAAMMNVGIKTSRKALDILEVVAAYLKTGVYPPSLDLGSVYKPGATF